MKPTCLLTYGLAGLQSPRLGHGPDSPREFHISRASRLRYRFDEALFSSRGNVLFADFHAVRRFAHRLNEQRDLAAFPETAVRAGPLNAMGLIDEILHEVARLYRRQIDPRALDRALEFLYDRLGQTAVDGCLLRFCEEFPPLAVHRGQLSAAAFLDSDAGEPGRPAALEELLLLWLANANPAFSPYRELFADDGLAAAGSYRDIVRLCGEFLDRKSVV
jgi:prepilin-type processing-associated H-X9-DG protein